jgi:putative peptide zinc metalloprotease protein
MAGGGKTFSESWYRVAGLKVRLHATVRVRKQLFRGETWYVLRDPFNNQYFRLRPAAHDFVLRLRPDRTVEEVWKECLERDPENAPGQGDVIQLLTQLYFANLLHFETPADSAKLFERYRKRRQRELKSRLLGIMFMRIPLLDPEFLLRRMMPLLKALISPAGALLWLGVVGMAVKVVIDRFGQLADQVQGVLAPDNLFFLYLGLVVVKSLHEFGHAMVCRRFGGEVHAMGVMFLVFTPLPYMDATSSWSFRSRWQRALVGGAGMIFEIFVAALAVFLWAYTGQGTLNSLAYNVMFIASVSTLVFNANPLLRFDGYYILSDLLDIPNLGTRANRHLRHLVERYLFGYRESTSPTASTKEAFWLTVYGILSGIYRLVVFSGIIFFVADKFLLAGMVMALLCVIAWGVVPLFRLLSYLATSPRLAKTRLRAAAVCLGFLMAVAAFLAFWPFANRFRAPGVAETIQYTQVINETPGYVRQIFVPSGTEVKEGTALVGLSDRELDLAMEAALAQRREAEALELRALSGGSADVQPIRKRLESIAARIADLEGKKASLTVRARQAGVWVSPNVRDLTGAWVHRGAVLGKIVNRGEFRFTAVVSQSEAAELFNGQIRKVEVRLRGQGGENLEVPRYRIIPFQQEKLPSAALGWRGGGDVAVSAKDQAGLKTVEPFFQIIADLKPGPDALLLHGRSGRVRFTLESRPLLAQWTHSFRQLLQKRYKI